MLRGLFSFTGLVVALALFLLVNAVGWTALRTVRADLTDGSLYTLSDGTKEILGNLEEPVTLRYFYSRKVGQGLGGLPEYAQRVRELLEEYQAYSKGKLRLEIIEPEPFSEAEDEAVAYGLSGPAVNQAGDRVYFGLAGTNTVDDLEIIPFFDQRREEFLEYDLTQLVDNLSSLGPKRVVGLMSSLPLRGGAFNPMNPQAPREPGWVIVGQIEEAGFEVRDLDPASTDSIDPDEIDVLMLVHPKDLPETTRFAIDQFVLGGGKALVFVDGFANMERPAPGQNPMMAERGSDLPDLFEAWGVELVPGKLAGDRRNANRIPYGGGVIDFPLFPSIRSEGMDGEDVVTSQLATVNVIMAGVLEPTADATTTFSPLLRTSTESMEVDAMSVQFGPDPERILADFVPSGESLTIAARVSGPIRTAFPGGRPAAAEEDPLADDGDAAEESEESQQWLQEGTLNAIVVTDTDMLSDNAWVQVSNFLGSQLLQPLADNGDFTINALDNLSGSQALISLRSRGRYSRPYDRKLELERRADAEFRAKEQALQARLEETERKLSELQFSESDSGQLILSPEQQAELEKFQQERIETRKELRSVQLQLRKDIESLGTLLTLLNMFAVPGLLALGAAVMAFRSPRR